jgi:Concanavalin A-like lectin/glucanases superfamily/FG-GAP-like repeat
MKTIQTVLVCCVLGFSLKAQTAFNLSSSPGVGSGPDSVAAADVNGDGQVDLVCANYYGDSLSVLTNDGVGGFVLSGTYPVGGYPSPVITADVNKDGKTDLISVNGLDSSLSVLTNNGSGGFVLAGTYHVSNPPTSVVAADVNGDGNVDLISANWGGGGSGGVGTTLTVLTNNGTGGFAVASSPIVDNLPFSVTAADVNGNGKIDLICASWGNNILSVLTNNGSGGFVLSCTNVVGNEPRSVIAADVNGDGKVDLICANTGNGSGNTLTVLTNNGNGRFTLSSSPVVGRGAIAVAAADVNGDGWVDLISANNGDSTLSVLTNNGSGGFVLATNLSVGSGPNAVTAADLNGDEKVDLISANSGNNTLSVLTNATPFPSSGSFSPTNGLVAYYPFNGNANDASGHSINGTVYGATLCADRFGQTNSAYYFNGVNSYIGFSSVPLSQTDNWTITAWVSPASLAQYAEAVCLGYDDGRSGNGFELGMAQDHYNPGNHLMAVFGGVGWIDSGYVFPASNVWHQVVMLRRNGVTQFYVDGNETPDSDSSMPITPSAFRIGSATGTRFFGGAIDDVRIYNRALSSDEVAQLYALESTSPVHGATAIAILDYGFVVHVIVTDGGYGYTNTPMVRFIGGGGSGAQAVAVVSNGVVTAINVLDAGYGYTNAPLVVIGPPYIPNPVLSVARLSFLSFSNLNVGSSYQLQESYLWYWTNQLDSFTATNAVYTQAVSGEAGGGDYRLALAPVPAQAFATAQVVNKFVVGATVTSGGSGYVTAPAVSFAGGGGSGATGVAQISAGVVTNIEIINTGGGYTNPPMVEIAPPPVVALEPAILPGIRLDAADLIPYDNYQIEFAPDAAGGWMNLEGGSFTPTDTMHSQDILIPSGTGFFRLLFVP